MLDLKPPDGSGTMDELGDNCIKMFIWGGNSSEKQSEIYCSGFYDWSLFCYAVLSILSSFTKKRQDFN